MKKVKTKDINIAILRIEGTNCEQESYDAFRRLGAKPEFVHLKQLLHIDCDKDVIEHSCEKTDEQRQIQLIDVEYFKDGKALDDKANFCEHCKQVFIFKS